MPRQICFLQKYRGIEVKTKSGGVNVCYGIEEGKKKTFVETAQLLGSSISKAIEAFMQMFNASETDAKITANKYWKKAKTSC
ncbi:MAG: hypothetical protein IJ153_07505 [Clostridia bacterium]|nr:hypothetical protein [Clostridia bacterium]